MQPAGGVFTLVGAGHYSGMAACSDPTGPRVRFTYNQLRASHPNHLSSPPPHVHIPEGHTAFEQLLLKGATEKFPPPAGMERRETQRTEKKRQGRDFNVSQPSQQVLHRGISQLTPPTPARAGFQVDTRRFAQVVLSGLGRKTDRVGSEDNNTDGQKSTPWRLRESSARPGKHRLSDAHAFHRFH